jgi:hypothetical protein
MMDPIQVEEVAVPVFITQEAQQLADQFARQQFNEAKAQQVRRNTLAVCAVNNYLKILGIPSDLSNCDSWNPVMRMITNVADLEVRGLGRIECRPVSFSQQDVASVCSVPTEVQGDRIAYIFVQIDPEQPEALILGFVEQLESEILPLSYLRPMSDLPAYLEQWNPQSQTNHVTQLTHWLQGQIEAGWRSLEEIISIEELLSVFSPSFTLAPSFRSASVAFPLRSVMTDLAQQGLQIPPEARGAYQNLRLGEFPLRLYAMTWTSLLNDQTPAWVLLIVIVGETGEPIPIGTRLQIRDSDHPLVDQVLQFESPQPYLYGVAGNTQDESLWVTITMNSEVIILPPFTLQSNAQP